VLAKAGTHIFLCLFAFVLAKAGTHIFLCLFAFVLAKAGRASYGGVRESQLVTANGF
jgi:hypothetical protein